MTSILIRAAKDSDQAEWAQLYAGYAAFYKVEQTGEMRAKVWDWIMSPQSEVNALVAERDGRLIGLAHYRPYMRPLAASVGGFLDDLFLTPDARGSGAAGMLIDALSAIGREKGWTVIRWITAADNSRARALYDQVAKETPWVTYDIKL
jgi:GNAT superfamily N-acetyltransferase